jgi:SNF2 family DNA or RNA helicase
MKLWEHQAQAIAQAEGLNYFGLFFEPGTGKTRTMIEIYRQKCKDAGHVVPALIICPPVVIPNWRNEILQFSKIKSERIVLLQGSGVSRAERILEADPHSVFITNYEAFTMPLIPVALQNWCEIHRPLLVLDEAHKIKDHAGKRSKAIQKLSAHCRSRYLLTGTPILNSLMDLFAQFLVLDQGARFGRNFFSFRATYFDDKNKYMPAGRHFPDWRPRPGAAEKIQKLISDCTLTAEKSKCLDLPPMVKKTIEVSMSKEQSRLYKEMRDSLLATLETRPGETKVSIAELAITKALRLQQIVSGHIRVEGDFESGSERKTIRLKDNPRRDALKGLLEDLAPHHKVLVWAVFKDNYADVREVCDALKLKYVELHGEVRDKQSQVDAFENDPQVRVLIGHPGSGGIGVNLVSASYSIFYSRSFSLEFDIQAEARNYRGGSNKHKSVTRIDLVTPGTIDEVVLKALASKTELSEKVLKSHLREL